MPDTEFNCLPTIIGSMPGTDPVEACLLINSYLKDIPAWPQLPNRSFLENMYAQFSQGFPGVVVGEGRLSVDRSRDWDKSLEQLYTAYLGNDSSKYPVTSEYAAGLHTFISLATPPLPAVKGQITGPVSWGLSVTDEQQKPIIYDDTLADATAKLLKLKASWQEKLLKQVSKNTIIFIDEPYMAAYGSAFVLLSKEKVVGLIEEVLGGISGIKGIHCCGNTDWLVLLETSTNIISFDTYNYAQSLSLYPLEVKRFLARKGAIAWGIVPNEAKTLSKETVASLKERLEEAAAPFTRNGIPFRELLKHSLITPSCTLAPLETKETVGRALELLVELSEEMRKDYL